MTIAKVKSYQIKISATEHKIPVVNGVHLHSIQNPIKEAESLVAKYRKVISEKNNILVLGLGFYYHIDLIAKELESYYGNDYSIIVIEPSIQTLRHYESFAIHTPNNISILAGANIEALYRNPLLIKFLLKTPGLIAHPASLKVFYNYFTSFLTYTSSPILKHVNEFINAPDLRGYLIRMNQELELKSAIDLHVNNKSTFNDNLDFCLIAFDKLISFDERTI